MSVASHLGIAVREYDRRIRTFIPNYAEMLDEAANALDASARTIVDLGVGTGALAARCLRHAPAARDLSPRRFATCAPKIETSPGRSDFGAGNGKRTRAFSLGS